MGFSARVGMGWCVTLLGCCCFCFGQLQEQSPRLDVIHKPSTGCPADRAEVRGLFLELNGSREDACVAHSTLSRPDLDHANVSYDYLAVGESIEFELVSPRHRQSENRGQPPGAEQTK